MLVTLKEILSSGKTVAGFNVFGYEDAISVIKGAERVGCPVILMTNKNAVEFMPIEALGKLLGVLAENAKVDVCVHLDHSTSFANIQRAIDSGFTSVMFDGSQLPLEENIESTKKVVEMAHEKGVSVEAEIGAVGYSDPTIKFKSAYTDPDEAVRFVKETGIDAVAVAIGTVHRMEYQGAKIDFDLLSKIKNVVSVPIVIHGASGVEDKDIKKMCEYGVGKINIGTALRMTFGKTLREEMEKKPDVFDRIELFKEPMHAVEEKTIEKLKLTSLIEE